jgi:glyceraldehyde 3-phosphate dehydrogenase
MPVKVGINGFGRIGRNIFRTALDDSAIEIVAVNDITDPKTLAYLLKYDSLLGNLPHRVTHTADSVSVDGKRFQFFKVKDPAQLDWASVGAQIVVESTGLFTGEEGDHLRAGYRPGPYAGAGRERQDLRSRETRRGFERFVHD